jgi:putative tricarboxylic transport membrane protein
MERFNQGRREFLKLLGMGGGAALFGGVRVCLGAAKEIFPADRITWICYVKAGGGWDVVARLLSPYLVKYIKEVSKGAKGGDMVIKNVSEAGGQRAFSSIFHAKPNGYIIGDFNAAFATEDIGSKPDFDYTKFTFLVRTTASTRVILVNKNGFKSWDEMMKAGKEKELKWAASNFGRGHHVACILVKEAAKVPARLINFPGAAENLNALLRGDVQLAIATAEGIAGLIDSGEARVLTVLSDTSPYPGVPSIAQLGYPELANPLKLHRLVIGPPNLPKEVCDTYIETFKKVFIDKDFLAQAKKIDFEPEPLYGADAEQLAKKFFSYYDEKAPILQKYLK